MIGIGIQSVKIIAEINSNLRFQLTLDIKKMDTLLLMQRNIPLEQNTTASSLNLLDPGIEKDLQLLEREASWQVSQTVKISF